MEIENGFDNVLGCVICFDRRNGNGLFAFGGMYRDSLCGMYAVSIVPCVTDTSGGSGTNISEGSGTRTDEAAHLPTEGWGY